MRIKMGGFSDFLAKQLAATQAQATPELAARIQRGKHILTGAGNALKTVDEAVGGAAGALLKPGPEIAGHAVSPLQFGYESLRASPRAAKAVAFGLPTYYLLRDQAGKDIVPHLNEAIQEGREVYASTEEFVEKKKAQMEKRAFGSEMLAGLGKALGGSGGAIGEAAGQGLGAIAHGGARMPIGMGMLGGAALLGGGALLGKLLGKTQETAQYQVNRAVNPLTDRVRADELMATSFFNNIGSEMAKTITGLLKDVASKAVGALKPGPESIEMVQSMSQGDPILNRADPQSILNAYHTMVKFAPTLATDENAVRSFLREAVVMGSGPDYATISALAKAEANVRNATGNIPKPNL